ncbi:MAG: hypothetical protein J6R29_06010 [Clostridia bacterium]|nr:hypothetical protein [Clostridia bacterium]
MSAIKIESKFFNAKDTLECGQVFRYSISDGVYTVYSLDKRCKLYTKNGYTYLESEDLDYFSTYFDLNTDYEKIYNEILSLNEPFLTQVISRAKGIRILRQDVTETAFSFIISQNNNIKRIQKIIEKLCESFGQKVVKSDGEFYAFPTVSALSSANVEFYKSIGLGYRAQYIHGFASLLNGGYNLENLRNLNTCDVTKELLKIKGIGKKVADCITLFGYSKTDSFPVDTWIEKIYVQNLNGTEKDRVKISNELSTKFGKLSGYIQQYVFYYKRSLENK